MSLTDRKKQDRADSRLGCLVCIVLASLLIWKFAPSVPSRIHSAYHGFLLSGTGPDLQAKDKEKRLNEYFQEGNTNWETHRLGKPKIERDVTSKLKSAIRDRDDHQCVICGLTEPLEVDHTRALENGGDNEPDNLATLCRNCHGLKGSMDKSLRRKRKNLLRDRQRK